MDTGVAVLRQQARLGLEEKEHRFYHVLYVTPSATVIGKDRIAKNRLASFGG